MVEFRAAFDYANVSVRNGLDQATLQLFLARVKDQVPALMIQVEMPQEEFKEMRIADGPDKIDSSAVLVCSDDR